MPSQADFVKDYAAKRAAQMERARQLREMREQQQPQQQQHTQAPGSAGTVRRPSATTQPRTPPAGHADSAQFGRGSAGHHQPTHQAHPGPSHAPSRAQAPGPGPGPGARGDTVKVSHGDFQRAVGLGIITQVQCDQLWAAMGSAPAPGPDPARRAPEPAYAQPQVQQQYHAAAYDARGGTPEYDAYGHEEEAPPPSLRTQQPAQRGSRSQRGWNSDVTPDPDPYDEPPPPAANPSRGTPGRTRRPQVPEWNDGAEDGDGTFGAPPPVRGTRGTTRPDPRAREHHDTRHDDRYGDPEEYAPPAPAPKVGRRGGPPSRAARQAEPEVAAPPVDEDEVAEFERQKAEAAARLEEELAMAEDTAEPMMECRECGRSFRRSVCLRHQKTCAKANKKRRAFDMKGQRAEGVEGLVEVQRQAKMDARLGRKPPAQARGHEDRPAGAGGKPIPKWKMQSEQLKAAMKASRAVTEAEAKGLPPPPAPSVPAEYDDRVPCPHCGRKFAGDVAERHIPKCKNIIAKPGAVRGPRR